MSNIKQAPFADQDVCSLGVTFNGRLVLADGMRYPLALLMLRSFFRPSADHCSLQRHICALELLAQCCLLWMASEMLPRASHQLTLPMRSDNVGAELASAKGMSSVKVLGDVLRAFLDFQRRNGLLSSIEHIPGYRNDLADELSRLKGASAPLPECPGRASLPS